MSSWSQIDDVNKKLQVLQDSVSRIESYVRKLELYSHGGRTTYMGNGLVLVRCVIGGANLVYLVEGDDRLISPWFIGNGRYEVELTDYFLRVLRPTDHCFDIGANFGYFTLLFARFCPNGKVLGIEPVESLFKIIRDNIHINGRGSMASVRHGAICDTERTLTLFRRVGRAGNTSVHKVGNDLLNKLGEEASEAFEVQGTTIDKQAAFFAGKIDIMKIDIEGAEPLAFDGASEVIAKNPGLQIVMEWSPGQIRAAGFDIANFVSRLSELGLGFHRLDPAATAITRDELLNLPYAAGILLTRHPRRPGAEG